MKIGNFIKDKGRENLWEKFFEGFGVVVEHYCCGSWSLLHLTLVERKPLLPYFPSSFIE